MIDMLREDMHVYIDNLSSDYKHQLSDIIDYVTQYRFQGGPEQPIRYLEMKVDKNDIDLAHPHLIDTIVEGKTRLIVDAVDGGTFIITKIWLNNNSYDLVATGIEITMNTSVISESLATTIQNSNKDPPVIVKAIFDDWESTLHLSKDDNNYEEGSEKYDDDFRIYFSKTFALQSGGSYDYEQPRNTGINKISFKKDMPTLVAINMCALLDDAFVFIAGRDWTVNGVTKRINTLHYVSYKDILPLASNPGDSEKDGVINIYPGLTSQYVNYSKFDLMMYQRLMGISSKNSEGSETIINQQIVSMDINPGDTYGEYTARNTSSYAMYGDYAGAKVSSDLMISFEYNGTFTSKKIAENIVKRYKDPTRSITFELSEVINDTAKGTSGWKGQISPFSYANKIVDSVNRITLTNAHLCDNTTDEFMLRLSTFIRSYPEMTSEYTFGVMKETTLSQELANKLTGMSGNVADIRVNGSSITQNGIIIADTTPSSTAQTPAHLITSNGVYTALTDGTVTKVGTATVGSNTKPVYLNAGVPTAFTGNTGSDTKPLKISGGALTPVTNDLATKSSVDNIIDGTTTVGKADVLTSGDKTVDGNLNVEGNVIIKNGYTLKLGTSGDGISEKTYPTYIASFDNNTSSGLYWSNADQLSVYSSARLSGKKVVWGYATNRPDDYRVEVSFDSGTFSNTPEMILVTPQGDNTDYPVNGWKIQGQSNTGFTIRMNAGYNNITRYWWMAIGT